VRYASPVTDPWYKSTRPFGQIDYLVGSNSARGNNTTTNQPIDLFAHDEPASPLACTLQQQFCNPSLATGRRCGSLKAPYDALAEAASLFADAAFRRISWVDKSVLSPSPDLPTIVSSLGASSLSSRYGLAASHVMEALPDNQWMLDVQRWFEIWLAGIQGSFITTATGPSDMSVAWLYDSLPANAEETNLCQNQVG
jgi:hypothetical protein